MARREARGLSQADLAAKVGSDTTTVSRWETGKNRPKGKETLSKLKAELDIEQAELDRLFLDWISDERHMKRYTIQGYEFLEANGMDEYDLLDRLIAIDTAVIPEIKREEEGTTDQWAPIFHASPYTWKLLTTGDEVAGYWHYICLNDEQFQLAKAGKLQESSLKDDMLVHLTHSGSERDFKMFISMIAIDSKHQEPDRSSKLLLSFIREFGRLAKAGFFFSEICAVALTPIGLQMCLDFGMQKVGRQEGIGDDLIEDVFLITGKDVPRRGFLAKNSLVANAYRKRFG
ncbi:helix-turn-helix transcriptional regulator [Yoonia sp. SS1-5]|uniref:Helix-turn-helix domain-containing protein n=1 Tax=Yoonia rhodophyticola TaxID=3137370 RepID=A0AAN0MAY8_9RHOB